MKTKLVITLTMPLLLAACMKMGSPAKPEASLSSTQPGAFQTPPDGSVVAGGGDKVSGTGAMSVPTADALIARVQNAIGVSSTAGNFSRALTQLRGNLPKSTDPTKATGFDSAQLLIYAACSDLTTGGNASKMTTQYKVNAGTNIAGNSANLVAAGVAMLDAHTAGLASQGPSSAEVTAAFQKLVSTVQGVANNTSTIAFMSVCIAANTAGAAMMGF